MAKKIAAGLLMYRKKNNQSEVFLVHPGGPYNKNKDIGVWSIPKGLANPDEDLFQAAKREFQEETGTVIASVAKQSSFVSLGFITYKSGKVVHAWAFAGDLPEKFILKSNPSDSGWPENDKAQFFPLETAKSKILPAQVEFLVRLASRV